MSKIYKRNCDECGKYYEGQGVRFCSYRCRGNARRTSPLKDKYCEECGKLYVGKGKRFCSYECRGGDPVRRFWSKVDIRDLLGCWNWKAGLSAGYGEFFYNGQAIGSHRFVWELVYGAIPENFHVLHRCDNPKCCNPSHLFVGMSKDNAQDMISKGRQVWVRGERHGLAKLKEADIRKIRKLVAAEITHIKVAGMFGVNRGAITKIANHKRWAHVN